jgi:hypothetical protein
VQVRRFDRATRDFHDEPDLDKLTSITLGRSREQDSATSMAKLAGNENSTASPPVERDERRFTLFVRRHAVFLAILVLAAASRFVILFASQTHVHSDEAIIGLMAKHIREGRFYPFYMYGQPYNAGAACEAYLGALAFTVFGDGVLPLKCCIVVLSLVCLALFYRWVLQIYGRETAIFASVAFVMSPSLVKWHLQVRGYSPYFLVLPILGSLFFWIDSASTRPSLRTFLFGLVSGLSVMCLELALFPVAAFWALLAVRRKLSAKTAVSSLLGFLAGYSPAIVYNLTHQMSNWREVFLYKTGSGVTPYLNSGTYAHILLDEMPKFFGPDTTLWYYPERPISGYVFYAIALLAIAFAVIPFIRSPSRIFKSVLSGAGAADQDLLMLLLTLACFVPYLLNWMRTPGYFLGGCFFLSILVGRMLARCLAGSHASRLFGAGVLAIVIIAGSGVVVQVGSRPEIETLTYDKSGKLQMTRLPAKDLEGVEDHLFREKISSVWATTSFVYPLIFESDEKLSASDAIFGTYRPIYPTSVPQKLPRPDERTAFVMETDSPVRESVEKGFAQAKGVRPAFAEFGRLTVIDAPPRGR